MANALTEGKRSENNFPCLTLSRGWWVTEARRTYPKALKGCFGGLRLWHPLDCADCNTSHPKLAQRSDLRMPLSNSAASRQGKAAARPRGNGKHFHDANSNVEGWMPAGSQGLTRCHTMEHRCHRCPLLSPVRFVSSSGCSVPLPPPPGVSRRLQHRPAQPPLRGPFFWSVVTSRQRSRHRVLPRDGRRTSDTLQ